MTVVCTESRRYGLIDAINPDEYKLFANLFRDITEVPLVAGRQDNPFDAGLSRGDHFLLDAAHRQNQAPQTDLPRHRSIARYCPLSQ